jgi:hypothetical protein
MVSITVPLFNLNGGNGFIMFRLYLVWVLVSDLFPDCTHDRYAFVSP